VYIVVSIQLLAANVLLNQPLVNVHVTAANLLFQQGDIDIYVQCTSTLCLLPVCTASSYYFMCLLSLKVGDIADAVAQQFVPTFQSGIVTIANTALNNKVNTYPTTIPLPEYGLSLNLLGGFEFLPNQDNSNLVLYGEGTAKIPYLLDLTVLRCLPKWRQTSSTQSSNRSSRFSLFNQPKSYADNHYARSGR
jgi:hypothetical protein